jgi:hypothetical protein
MFQQRPGDARGFCARGVSMSISLSFPWRETLARLLISSAAAGVRVGGLDLAKNLDPLYSRISRVLDPDAVRGPNLGLAVLHADR